MKEIRSDAKNLRDLLSGTKFAIDYYQREYSWQKKQVEELVNDLLDKFKESYESGDERGAVENYGHYFLGPIIISDREGKKFIIDGQQRLTTLSLILIHIYRLFNDERRKEKLSEAQLSEEQGTKEQLIDLIYSFKYGKRSFNIDIDERKPCMEALFIGRTVDTDGQSVSVVNIVNRFEDIEIPDDIGDETLPYFSDWLIEKVYLIEITASSDNDAYTIFETMNDRGLSLTPTEMLKGYILVNIADPKHRTRAGQFWRERIADLQDIGKMEDADAIKAWLRSQYAQTIRKRKRDAAPEDFDLIGTAFHRWVNEKKKVLDLFSSSDFARFIEEDFNFYSGWYIRLRKAAETIEQGLETVHYCAQNKFTLQYPVLLAPLQRKDSEQDIQRKLRIVSAYLDILITRRTWNRRAIDYSTMQYAMFLVMREIRNKDISTLVDILTKKLAEEDATFAANDQFQLYRNSTKIHIILARLTDYVETASGIPSRYQEYIQRGGKKAYEVEHIWANHFERHADEFERPSDFAEYRNRIGGLLLLPKSLNRSYRDRPYEEKREHYLKNNLLAQSLHEKAYERNPGFKRFIDSSNLPFRWHSEFRKKDLDERQNLYTRLAEEIWNPERLKRAAES